MSYKNYLIFDLDDTILDFKKGEQEGLNKIFKKHMVPDVRFDQWLLIFQRVNSRIWSQIEEGASAKELLETRFSKTYQEFGIEKDGRLLESEYRSYLDQNFFVLKGAKEMLEQLKKQNFQVVAGTNGKSSTQRSRLKGTGLEPFFEDVVISEEIGYAKPHQKFFEILMDRNKGMKTQNTLMIGDSLRSDIQGAINSGIRNIWFNPFKNENATEIIPDFEVATFEELQQIIELNSGIKQNSK
ncbi:YjjG family noncanonical pyrimidine nucleotidase [Marinilactibacillus psychrotolerans]|uniref:YjjG family noncanonical pyrimidine nucleotidase n=1 Tax=Marinilactibacillus psychrotolerans TaxID=191770 RepID=UPI0039AF306D